MSERERRERGTVGGKEESIRERERKKEGWMRNGRRDVQKERAGKT
jgi:hypothetical protein